MIMSTVTRSCPPLPVTAATAWARMDFTISIVPAAVPVTVSGPAASSPPPVPSSPAATTNPPPTPSATASLLTNPPSVPASPQIVLSPPLFPQPHCIPSTTPPPPILSALPFFVIAIPLRCAKSVIIDSNFTATPHGISYMPFLILHF